MCIFDPTNSCIFLIKVFFCSLLTFAGALNVERASQAANKSASQQITLQVWSCLYFVVSWSCINHSLFMVFPDKEKKTEDTSLYKNCQLIRTCCSGNHQLCCTFSGVAQSRPTSLTSKTVNQPTNQITKGSRSISFNHRLKIKSIQSARKISFGAKYVMREVVSSRGRWFMIRTMTKELGETIFQFLGLLNTASVTHNTTVLVMGIVIALNLIVLNAINLMLRRWKGNVGGGGGGGGGGGDGSVVVVV